MTTGCAPTAPLVLLVEDDQDSREMYGIALGASGFRVAAAADGVEGFDAAMFHRPDLVVTDIVMPRMDGLELCHRLRENLATRQIPVVAVTAHVPDLARLQSLYDEGAESVLIKPCAPDRLLAEVRRVLSRSQALRARSVAVRRRAHVVQLKSARLHEEVIAHGERFQRFVRRLSDISDTIRTEFVEMPGMSLTLEQAMRLWDVDSKRLRYILQSLVDEGFLTLQNGRFLKRR